MEVSFYGHKENAEIVKNSLPSLIEHSSLTSLFNNENSSLKIVDSTHVNKLDKKYKESEMSNKSFSVVLLSEKSPDANLKILKDYPFISQIFIKNSPSLADQLLLAHRFSQTNNPISQNIDWSFEKMKMIESHNQKEVFDEVAKRCECLPIFEGFPEIAQVVCAELLSNAFYDAPRDKRTGKALITDRKVKVSLQLPHHVNFSFGQEGNRYLWFKTADSFGSFSRSKLTQALHRASAERLAITKQPGGAGLGLYMLYQWASSLCFIFDKGKRTTIFVKLKLTKRNLHFSNELPSIHILEI